MLKINWQKTAFILADIALGAYLLLAVTAFNRPDQTDNYCSDVKIDIKDGVVQGFLDDHEIKRLLQQARLYPLGEAMEQVDVRKIEEALRQNPFVEEAECYKTLTGSICIHLSQRLPVMRVMADNGDDYYLDEQGNVMPNTHFTSSLVVATGNIQRPYAQKWLTRIGRYLMHHELWRSQVEQLNVLADGTVELVPRVGDHIVYIGQPVALARKFDRLEKFYKYGLSQAGWNKYDYISLEFDNQIICKKAKE